MSDKYRRHRSDAAYYTRRLIGAYDICPSIRNIFEENVTFIQCIGHMAFTFYSSYDPPVTIQPGDEIRTRCVYSSNNKSQVTYFGAGTDDEMCYAFITYYPTHHLPPTLCASWKSVQRCHRYLEKFGGMLGDCRWRALVNPEDQEHKRIIAQYYAPNSCGTFVKSEQCSDNCTKASRKLAKHACLQGEVGQWAMYKLRTSPKGQVFLNTLKKCGAFANQAAFVRVGTWLVTISVLSVWIHTFLTAHL